MKSGFVALVGRSNVGKSTLLNALVGSKIAIVTPKPQTTRRPIRGIVHDPRGQIVFTDTPGVFHGKTDALSQRLNQIVREQVEGIDAIVYVMDPTRAYGPEEENIQRLIRKLTIPIIAVINKTDMDPRALGSLEEARRTDVGQKITLELSALLGKNIPALLDALFAVLPEGAPHYPEHQLTDLDNQQWIAELVREKVFLRLEEELPYSVHVEVTEIEKRPNDMRYIAATVWTTDDRYKKMIVGAGARMIKQIGMDVRTELEAATDEKIFLDLNVRVDPKWPERFR